VVGVEVLVPLILDGPAGPPPHAAAIATTIRHDPMNRVRTAVNAFLLHRATRGSVRATQPQRSYPALTV